MASGDRVEQTDLAANPQYSASLAPAHRPRGDQLDPGRKDALLTRTVHLYESGSSVERAGLAMLSSFATTVAAARLVNYVRERRRPAPQLRSWGRHAYHLPGRERIRVHHFVPGVGLAFASGAAAIVSREDKRELWFGVPFGAGVGLTFDEIALMTEIDNPYWKSEKLSITQAVIAGLGALALGIRLHLRARGRRPERERRDSNPRPPA